VLSAVSGLDGVIHAKARLAVLCALAAHRTLTFTQLREMVQLSDGNLSAQLRRLDNSGYMTTSRSFVGRVPRRSYSLTSTGADALRRYFDEVSGLIAWTLERWEAPVTRT
jgi:DNA-binding HxlR family transcriptional regulator